MSGNYLRYVECKTKYLDLSGGGDSDEIFKGRFLFKDKYVDDDMKKLVEERDSKTYNFYIVRHGEGDHNVASVFKKHTITDPRLTPVGEDQAMNAGKALAKQNIKFDYFFVSDLLRTRMTLREILKVLDVNEESKKIVVLPCSHEIGSIGQENKMKCDEIQACIKQKGGDDMMGKEENNVTERKEENVTGKKEIKRKNIYFSCTI